MEKCNSRRCVPVTFVSMGSEVFASVRSQRHMGIAFHIKYITVIISMDNTEAFSDLCHGARYDRHLLDSDDAKIPDRQ